MRVLVNVVAVLACAGLAGMSSLLPSVPSDAAPNILVAAAEAADGAPNAATQRHPGGLAAHFVAANTSHDGQLTKAQSDAIGWKRVSKHFDEIDGDHRGWVGIDQIRAYNQSHHKHRANATTS